MSTLVSLRIIAQVDRLTALIEYGANDSVWKYARRYCEEHNVKVRVAGEMVSVMDICDE